MGLNVSHDAFNGAYSAFNRFRNAVCVAMGGKWPDALSVDQIWYWGDDYSAETHPGLYVFLNHSDCDGSILPRDAKRLADELQALLPALDRQGEGSGHIQRDGGYGTVARHFIEGCRAAAKSRQRLRFG